MAVGQAKTGVRQKDRHKPRQEAAAKEEAKTVAEERRRKPGWEVAVGSLKQLRPPSRSQPR